MICAKSKGAVGIMRILLVEDDLQICEVTKKYFESKGAEIVAVNNGADALAVTEGGLEGYSLVLLDIMLPGADGFAVCRSIRRRSDIPVIFLTGKDDAASVKSVLALKPAGYLLKSLPREKIVEEIDNFFNKNKI